jgi:hypothetical protein
MLVEKEILTMSVKNSSRILWGSLVLGLFFDILFWKKAPGISFFIFCMLIMLAGFVIAYLEGIKPAAHSWILAGLIIFFSAMTFIREEPFTTFINGLLTLTCLALLALTFSSGVWLKYSLADAATGLIRLIGSSLVGGSNLLSASPRMADTENPESQLLKQKKVSILAILRGIFLALPVVFFLALLLSSADPIFSKELERILNIDKWLEYAVRCVIICVIGYLLSGIYLYVIQKSSRTDLIGVEKPWFLPFLGFTESAIILGSVNLLFAFFVAIQFKYFFGGQANIQVDGYTFAEYARRGFGELITVAFLSLLLYLGLSTITRRKSLGNQKWFAGLGVALVGLVAVILVSSFYRLSLLEDAYGFSRLRTYSHMFMVWLGILLAAVIVLEIVNYRRGFAMAAFIMVIGFGISLNVLNVDSFILRANVNRAVSMGNLDYLYLQELSDDSVPEGLAQFRSVKDDEVKHLLGASLACRADGLEKRLVDRQWQSYHISFNTAVTELRSAREELRDYQVITTSGERYIYKVNTPIREKDCYSEVWRMD